MKKIRFLLLYCIAFSITITAVGQINLSFETEVNTVCNGVDLNYDGPKILINEVMLAPNPYDGSIYGCYSDPPPESCNGEWIELYNPDPCKYVDISCFFLGTAAPDVGSGANDYPGGFIIPELTLVPPYGFVIIRGTDAPPVPEHLLIQHGGNTIEIIVDDPARVCFGDGSRLWFPNNGGWMAIYDHNGIPQDAISWGDAEYFNPNTAPCNPGPVENCSYSGTLASYNEIPEGIKNYISNAYPETNKTLRRIPDGEDWEFNVQEDPTYGTCNSTCAPPPVITCNGKLTVTASGGTSPYSYLWNDGQVQITQTATSLCPGEYCVTVTDSESNVETACYSVENLSLDVAATTTTPEICAGESIFLNSDVNNGQAPYSFLWSGNDFSSDVQNPEITNAQVSHSGTYTVVVTDDNECTGEAQTTVEVTEIIVPEITGPDYICSNDPPVYFVGIPDGGWWSYPIIEDGEYTICYTLTIDCGSSTCITIPIYENIFIENFNQECNPTNTHYTISFDVVNQDGVPAGFYVNETEYFESFSETYPSQTEYGITVTDLNNACSYYPINGLIDCGCDTYAGTMSSLETVLLCLDDCTDDVEHNTGSENLDFNDAFQFIIHDGSYPVNILARNSTPVFCYPGVPGISLGQTYYISAIAGNDMGDGNVDINDPCFSRSIGTPVIWYGDTDATITPVGPFCEDDPAVTLSAATPGGTWSGLGITNPNTGIFDPTIAGGGNHVITYTVGTEGCMDTDQVTITVYPIPEVNITPAGPFDANNPEVTLSASPSGGTWSGNGITNSSTGTFDPAVAGVGNHIITYEVTVNGCTNSDQITIVVNDPVNIPIITSNNINIYPNPANNSIFIETEKTLDEISIIDIHGRTVIKQKNFTGGEIDISEIVTGVYFIRLKYKDEIFVEKLIVE